MLTIGGVAALAAVVSVGAATPAGACGGLVGENGTISLERTTTLAAYHDGIERYVESFTFTGQGEQVGSITPLPGVPTKVERGGDWTLQRLQQEVAPPANETASFDADAGAPLRSAKVILEAKIDALDITVLEGGADAVGKWALDHGFLLTPDAPEVLRFYAQRSPIFMAARFDASRAARLNQQAGDGTPIMVTIPTDDPWVPLRILGLGLEAQKRVQADVFLLTDEQPKMLAGGPGLTLARDEQASKFLLDDLRSDKGMGWVPDDMWLTYLQVDTPASTLDYDLAVSTRSTDLPAVSDTGVEAAQTRPIDVGTGDRTYWPIVAGAVVAIGVAFVLDRRRRPPLGAAA